MLRLLLGICAIVGALSHAQLAQAQACETDADCPEGMGCELAPVAAFDCRPGVPCDAGAPEPTGECEPQPLDCETDADCPEGLTCEEQSGSGAVACAVPAPGTDGEVICEEPEPTDPERQCAFERADCETDADCTAPGFECLVVEEGGGVSCSGTGSACAPGEDCPPPEEQCEVAPTQTERYCFPERRDCVVDSECAGTWRCTDLPEGAQRNPPAGWEGATRVCLPEGLALALTGQLEVGGSDSASVSSSADRAGAAAETKAAPAPAPGDGNGDGDGGGLCALTTPSAAGAGRGAPAGIVLLALAALRVRRSRG
ncbi:MAG: hypothetical protein PVI30_24655 [Myxococcales bacterium]|jgi:hypothetical protein